MTPAQASPKGPRGPWIRWLILPLILFMATLVLIGRTEKRALEMEIPAAFEGLAQDLLLIETPQQPIRIRITGTQSALAAIDPTKTVCHLDLSGVDAGTHIITVPTAAVDLPERVSLTAILTPSLTVTLENRATKTVDVIAVLEGNPAAGFAVASITLKPDQIRLEGTSAQLAGIEMVKTRPIDLAAAAESFKKEVPLNLPEAIASSPPMRLVVAQVTIEARIITRVLENIAIEVKDRSSRHRIHPATITLMVSGPAAIVDAIESDPAFAVTVDLDNLAPGTKTLKAAIKLPIGTTLVHVSPEHFSVSDLH